jgi:hypothetical protein
MVEIILMARAVAKPPDGGKDHRAKQIIARVGFGFFPPLV